MDMTVSMERPDGRRICKLLVIGLQMEYRSWTFFADNYSVLRLHCSPGRTMDRTSSSIVIHPAIWGLAHPATDRQKEDWRSEILTLRLP